MEKAKSSVASQDSLLSSTVSRPKSELGESEAEEEVLGRQVKGKPAFLK